MSIGQTETRELRCELSKEEVLVFAHQFASIDQDIEREEEALREHSKEVRETVKELREEKRRLRQAVAERAIHRGVFCRWSPDWHTKEMVLVREDTGEVVERRTMNRDELQMTLVDAEDSAVDRAADEFIATGATLYDAKHGKAEASA